MGFGGALHAWQQRLDLGKLLAADVAGIFLSSHAMNCQGGKNRKHVLNAVVLHSAAHHWLVKHLGAARGLRALSHCPWQAVVIP